MPLLLLRPDFCLVLPIHAPACASLPMLCFHYAILRAFPVVPCCALQGAHFYRRPLVPRCHYLPLHLPYPAATALPRCLVYFRLPALYRCGYFCRRLDYRGCCTFLRVPAAVRIAIAARSAVLLLPLLLPFGTAPATPCVAFCGVAVDVGWYVAVPSDSVAGLYAWRRHVFPRSCRYTSMRNAMTLF